MIKLLDVGRLSLDLDPELHEGRANELSSKDVSVHSFLLWPVDGTSLTSLNGLSPTLKQPSLALHCFPLVHFITTEINEGASPHL